MAIRDVFKCVVMSVVCLAATAQAQRVLVLPGAKSTTSTGTAFVAQPLAPASTLNIAPGAFLAFTNLDSSRYFVVTTTGLIVLDASGAQVQAPVTISQPVAGAAITPDRGKLVVVAGDSSSGSLTTFDVSGATVPAGSTLSAVANPRDVAISLDASTAYVVNDAGVTPVDLAGNVVGSTVALAGLTASASATPTVSVGPNGRVYATGLSAFYELHPKTLDTLHKIVVSGFPGKPSFLPDGTSATAANQLSGATQPDQAWVFNLTTGQLSGTLARTGTKVDQVFYASTTRIYAISKAFNYLYQFSPSNPSGSWTPVKPGVSTGTLSPEPSGAKYLYIAANTAILQFTLSDLSNQTIATAPLSTGAGPVAFLAPANVGHPTDRLKFNDDQTVAPGTPSLPLVVRVLDQYGNPLSGAGISWNSGGKVVLQGAMPATNAEGYATATATAPTTVGDYTVYATITGAPAMSTIPFKLHVGTPSTGGGGNSGPTGGITMVAGNGQVVLSGGVTDPLTVLVSDSSGNPVAGAKVTFSVSALGGLILAPSTQAGCTFTSGTVLVCPTDSTGMASVIFQGQVVIAQLNSFLASTITASTPTTSAGAGGTVTFTETSLPSTIPLPGGGNGLGPFPVVQTIAPAGSIKQISGNAGSTITGAFKVKVTTLLDAQAIPNVGLSVRSTAAYAAGATAPASCAGSGGTVLTGADGTATCNLVLGNQPGTYTLYRITGGFDATQYTLVIAAAPPPTPVPTTVALTTGDGQSAAIGQSVTLVGTVKDQTGKIMSGTPVTWTVLSGNVSYTARASSTNSSGQASATVTINAAGPIQIKLAAGTVSNIFHLTGTVVVGGIAPVSGDGQSATTGAAFSAPLVVKVTDNQGGIITAYPVTFSATGGATLSAASVNTDANGQASVSVTAGPTAGGIQVTATAGGQTVTFNLTARLPGPVLDPLKSFLNGASFAENYVAFGSIATIKAAGLTMGLNLQPGTCLTEGTIGGLPVTDRLPTRIAGVEFAIGGNLAPIFAICKNEDGTEQANIQVPFEVPPVKSWAVVRYNAGTPQMTEFATPELVVRNAAPGIFEYAVSDTAKAAVAVKADGSVISPTNPAHPGDTIEVYVTGLGPVLPTAASNVPGAGQKVYFTPTVALGGRQVAGVTAEYAHNGIGIYIVTFQIPQDQLPGDTVALQVGVLRKGDTSESAPVSQTARIAISK